MTPEAKTFRTKDGRELTFLFDMEGMIAAEDCANGDGGTANIKQIVLGAANARVGYLTALVYGGLKAHHPEISRKGAFDLIESDGTAVGKALWAALGLAMPEAKGKQNPPKAGSGTGSRSSPPGSKKASRKNGSGNRRRAATPSS